MMEMIYGQIGGAVAHFPIFAVISLFLGAFLTALVGKRRALLRRGIVFVSSLVSLVLVILMIPPVMSEGWIITYWMGGWEPVGQWAIGIGLEADALSLFFALIVTAAVFTAALYSFPYMAQDSQPENYYTLYLMLAGSLLGLVLSGDLFNIFVMIEIMTMTAVALTAFRVDYDGALEGAIKYMIVGSIGSSAVLVGIAILYSQLHTLNLAQLALRLPEANSPATAAAFAFLFVGFGSKAFLFPFHPLAADAHAVAPASISMIISGVITKCGVYGIIRLCYVLWQNMSLPAVSTAVTLIGAVSCFICVTMAFNQHNFKRLLAFHSISQIGYVIAAVGLGSFFGLEAGLFHAMNHTIFKGLLFLAAGAVQHAAGTLDLDRLGGLARKMPRTFLLFLIGAAAISGLPPFNGFASKWMIYQSVFEKAEESGNPVFILVLVLCLLSSVLTLASFVKVTQSVFFGPCRPEYAELRDVSAAMRVPMWILATLCVITGLFPGAVRNILLAPAAAAAGNPAAYIDAVFGVGTAAGAHIPEAAKASETLIGCWEPLSWLWLLLTVTCAVCFVMVLGGRPFGRTVQADDAEERRQASEKLFAGLPDPKYESFFSGEKAEFSHVGGSDLFWGFKYSLRRYFSYMRRWHSGNVNDYTRYGIAALAFMLAFAVLCL
ncbi:proton-conducting transporter transmembrane domain-containing protein [Lachnoclostridium sp. Marseille-P6806]|uniref:proton-conducting transporter transmembrane domain-containing protein n=1 Tax=Lachnoclostridium sp. Marseille-P6806 TaxID=2364793 RepID=UPI001031C30D|nr:proton-conducting transporter membrane subunit [Lachnoclostridium sp. Marseille-P6806]